MNEINVENPTSQNQNNKEEPFFKNLPFGTMSIVILLLLIQLVRKFEPTDIPFNWVIQSALIPDRLEYGLKYGGNILAIFWPFVGYQLLHAGWFHVLMNCGMLLQAGPIAEIGFIKGGNLLNYSQLKAIPSQRSNIARAAFWFVIYYIVCGIGSALGFLWINHEPNIILMGASGSISGVFAGFLIGAYKMVPRGTNLLRLLGGSAIAFLLLNVGGAFVARISDTIPIAWEAHLFGFITGIICYPIFYWLANSQE